MTVGMTAEITPEQFAADLRQLSTVDWARCWRGYAGAEPISWVAQFGWRLELVDHAENLRVILPSGSGLYLRQRHDTPEPYKVDHGRLVCWVGTAENVADNDVLVGEAERVWDEYLAAGAAVLGEPDMPGPRFPRDIVNVDERQPLRVAAWPVSKDAIVRAILRPADGTVTGRRTGRVTLRVEVTPYPDRSGGG